MELGYAVNSTRNPRTNIQVCLQFESRNNNFQFINKTKTLIEYFRSIDNQNQLQSQVWHSPRMRSTTLFWAAKTATFIQVSEV